MPETQFTEGPWQYRPDKYDDWGVVKAGAFALCQVRDPRFNSNDYLDECRGLKIDPWEFNARLVAAAPKLHESVTDAYMVLIAAGDALRASGRDRLADMCDMQAAKADAALASARGEQS